METVIYYFSGTGNSYRVACDLVRELGPTAQARPIAKVSGASADWGSRRVGIVFPVYMWGLPLMVWKFLEGMPRLDGRYFFSVATYGGSAGGALGMVDDLLKAKGLKLDAGFAVKMPGNYTPLYDVPAPEKVDELCRKAADRVREAAAKIKAGTAAGYPPGNFLVRLLLSKWFYRTASKKICEHDKMFELSAACNGCGTCYRVCPADNIRIENGRPTWLHRCEACLACLHWCPQRAINGSKTAKRGRYHHPEVKVAEMMVR